VEGYEKIIKPEICDILIPTDNYRNQWSNDENLEKAANETIRNQLAKHNKIKRATEKNTKAIKEFITSFVNLNNRQPMETEIIDNLKDKMDVVTIKKIIESGRSLSIKDSYRDENV
jgi:hypothetical protein